MQSKIIYKKWYESKTLWLNLIAIASIVLQSHTGLYLPMELQLLILSTINIILRSITHKPIIWSGVPTEIVDLEPDSIDAEPDSIDDFDLEEYMDGKVVPEDGFTSSGTNKDILYLNENLD